MILLEQLLITPEHSQRQTLLKANAPLHEPFFASLKTQILAIKENDPDQQLQLAALVDEALFWVADEPAEAMGLWAKGLNLMFLHQERMAAQIFGKAMRFYLAMQEYESYITLAGNLILTYLRTDQLAEADKLSQQLVAELDEQKNASLERIYRNWAMIKLELHESQAALDLMLKVEPGILTSGDPWRQAAFWGDMAAIYDQLDRYMEAEACLQKADAYFRRQPEQQFHWAVHAGHLANLYYRMGRLGEALLLSDEAVAVFEEQTDHKTPLARAMMVQAHILLELGQYEQVLRKLSPIHRWLESKREQANAALLGGIACMALQRYEQAESFLQWAMHQYAQASPYWLWTARRLLAQLYLVGGQPAQWQQGKVLVRQLLADFGGIRPVRAAEMKLLLAEYALVENNISEAKEWLAQVVPMPHDLPQLQIHFEYLQGQLAHRLTDWPAACVHYEQALALTHQVRDQFHLEMLQTGVMARREQLYQALLAVYLTQADWLALWHLGEAWRAYSLTAVLRYESILGSQDKPELETLYNKRAQRFRLCSQLYGEVENEPVSPAVEARLRQRIRELDVDLAELYGRLSMKEISESDALMFQTSLSPAQLSQYLADDTLLLTYTHVEENVVAMAVDSRGAIWQRPLPASWPTITAALVEFGQIGFQEWRFACQHQGSQFLKENFAHFLAKAQMRLHLLYDLLWRPVVEKTAAYKHIVIVPDDVLYYVPFHALYADQEYLMDRHVISYAPNATLYALGSQRARSRQGHWGKDVVLVAYQGAHQDLPHTSVETKHIQATYPQAIVLEHEKATPVALLAAAKSARILHLATHAETVHNNPFLSYLELASENGSSKDVTHFRVYDAAQLDLRQTDLVVLSACKTGQMAARGGDLLGLQWGFMHAGAYALLVNLWAVDDEATAVVMGEFYRQYRPEIGKAVGLQTAVHTLRQRASLNSEGDAWRFAHPYVWAPYVSYGFSGPV